MYKSGDLDSSEDKKDSKDKKKMEKSHIKITKQDPQSDDDDFDTHVFMLHGNDDEVIIDNTMMNLYCSQASSLIMIRISPHTIFANISRTRLDHLHHLQ